MVWLTLIIVIYFIAITIDTLFFDQKYIFSKSQFYYYLLLAKLGNAKAQCILGEYYFEGWGVNRDETEGIKWLLKAVSQGNAEAMYKIGQYCSYKGNDEEAVKWYSKSADQGNSSAKSNLDSLAKEKRENKAIESGEIWEGMTESQLIESRGEPDDILEGERRTIYRYGKIKGPRGGVKYDLEVTIKDYEVTFIKDNR